MIKSGTKLFFTFVIVQIISFAFVHGLPPRIEKRSNSSSLNSSSILGALAATQSNATATGPGSTVEISGIVSGDASSSLEALSSPTAVGSSSIASQVNCSEYSTSSASGGLSADALASGGCLMNMDNTGNHHYESAEKVEDSDDTSADQKDKVAIGMEGQVNSHGQQVAKPPDAPQEGTITQATVQNPMDGSVEAYQLVHGPQATSAFTGMMGHAQSDIVHGTQETLLTHASGETSIQSMITPFGTYGEKN